jgi:dUTP pyrophosphatase
MKYTMKNGATMPRRAHQTDAGLDLAPMASGCLDVLKSGRFSTGLSFEIPDGHVGLITARSSATMRGVQITGVVDAGYRGEVFIMVTNIGDEIVFFNAGDYIAQLLVVPCLTPELELVRELSSSPRGGKGFGSSGR